MPRGSRPPFLTRHRSFRRSRGAIRIACAGRRRTRPSSRAGTGRPRSSPLPRDRRAVNCPAQMACVRFELCAGERVVLADRPLVDAEHRQRQCRRDAGPVAAAAAVKDGGPGGRLREPLQERPVGALASLAVDQFAIEIAVETRSLLGRLPVRHLLGRQRLLLCEKGGFGKGRQMRRLVMPCGAQCTAPSSARSFASRKSITVRTPMASRRVARPAGVMACMRPERSRRRGRTVGRRHAL